MISDVVKNMIKRISLIGVLVIVFTSVLGTNIVDAEVPWANGKSVGKDLEVSLITFSPGDDISSWFGHSSILVKDHKYNIGRVYNYGMFNFGPDLLPQFLTGELRFWVGEASVAGTYRMYKSLNRDIVVQELNLSPEKRIEIAKHMADYVLPKNRYYIYDHYYDNCATRPRDVVDRASNGQFEVFSKQKSRFTLREHTFRYTQQNIYIAAILAAWMNREIDQPQTLWEDMFLPDELAKNLDGFSFVEEGVTKKMVKRTYTIFKADRDPAPAVPNVFWIRMLLIGLLFGGVGFFLRRRITSGFSKGQRIPYALFLIIFGLGIGLPSLGPIVFNFTHHTITHWNENLLMMNLLTFLPLPFGIAIIFNSKRAMKWLDLSWKMLLLGTLVLILLKATPWFVQENWNIIAFFFPVYVLLVLGSIGKK